MLIFSDPVKRAKGFSLIEAMVATAVMGFGLMAIATFHTKLVSGSAENKARMEALALAEEKIEEFRSETTQSSFDTALVDGSDANPIQGVNAEFTRSWDVEKTDDYYDVDVSVAWENRVGEPDSVTLSTSLIFEDPTLAGNKIEQNQPQAVDSPTGKAILGGEPFDGEADIENDDGMSEDIKENDRQLIDGDDNVVLTLQEACNVDGVCSEFVKINGTIYFDTANLADNYDYDGVFVIASDAAYCNRHVTKNGQTYFLADAVANHGGLTETPDGDYSYYDYTCYLGGGWNGNIGIVMNDPSQKDIACVGDPSIAVGMEGGPELAIRRSYRGMTYRIEEDENGDLVPVINEDTGMKIYQTVGIKDGAVFPQPGEAGHDFVVTQFNKNSTASDCGVSVEGTLTDGPLTRDDSYYSAPNDTVRGSQAGALFAGVPGDFICLNPDNIAFNQEKDGDVLAYEDFCPYDPTDPPASAHTITATVTVNHLLEPEKLNVFQVKTSDSTWEQPSTCVLQTTTDSQTGNTISRDMVYACEVYDWTDEGGDLMGWTGSVEIKSNDDEIICSPSTVLFDAISQDDSAQFTCLNGVESSIEGTIEPSTSTGNGEVISLEVVSNLSGNEQLSGPPSCQPINGDNNTSIFSCSTGVYSNEEQAWSGHINFELTDGDYLCEEVEESSWEIYWHQNGGLARLDIDNWPALMPLDFTNKVSVSNQPCSDI